MKIMKMLSAAALVAVLGGALTGCYVDAHPRWHRHYHPVIVVH